MDSASGLWAGCFLRLRKTFIFPLPLLFTTVRVSRGQGTVGRGTRARLSSPGPGGLSGASPGRGAGSPGRRCPLCPRRRGGPGSPGLRYLPQLPRQAAPSPSPRCTLHSSKGASLTAPHEIIIHYVTRREERECKCLDGISGNPRRDDLGAVIIHLIGAWGKLLDREM